MSAAVLLGRAFAKGLYGVDRDKSKAEFWLRKAIARCSTASCNYTEACSELDDLLETYPRQRRRVSRSALVIDDNESE
jgi:hypothetical protein